MRGPAAVAQALYRETEGSKELRRKVAEERKALPYFERFGDSKPSKKDRRVIDRVPRPTASPARVDGLPVHRMITPALSVFARRLTENTLYE